jgi:hypothetical protein
MSKNEQNLLFSLTSTLLILITFCIEIMPRLSVKHCRNGPGRYLRLYLKTTPGNQMTLLCFTVFLKTSSLYSLFSLRSSLRYWLVLYRALLKTACAPDCESICLRSVRARGGTSWANAAGHTGGTEANWPQDGVQWVFRSALYNS